MTKEELITVLNIVRTKFKVEVSKKTGWGKDEVQIAFEKALTYTVLEYATILDK